MIKTNTVCGSRTLNKHHCDHRLPFAKRVPPKGSPVVVVPDIICNSPGHCDPLCEKRYLRLKSARGNWAPKLVLQTSTAARLMCIAASAEPVCSVVIGSSHLSIWPKVLYGCMHTSDFAPYHDGPSWERAVCSRCQKHLIRCKVRSSGSPV